MHTETATGPARGPAITIENLSLCYGDDRLFEELSVEITGGQCTCILGPSGCGKSTLLRLISGADSLPFSGSIRIGSGGNRHCRTGWMSQKDLLLPWFSLLDNVLLGGKLRGTESAELRTRARTLLSRVGLADYQNVFPAALSGGMRQRGALLRTLMEERSVLLMDEPFSALDALTRVKLQDLTASMTRGATVLLVTHDPMEALRMGHTILVLSGKPVRVRSVVSPGGTPPRAVDDEEIHRHYGRLLGDLMAEARP